VTENFGAISEDASSVEKYHFMNNDPRIRTQRTDASRAASQGNGVSQPRNPVARTRQRVKPHGARERGPKFLAEAYGLAENPFGVTPDPRYLYESSTHLEAKSSLVVGIECAVGFQALIAPPGMGKTTLLCNILEEFDKIARTAFLFQTQGDSRDFLRSLIFELGGDAPDSDVVRMQEIINQLLIRERRAGRQTIVIIDEAQNLAPPVLETLRLLSNFETSTDKLLHIILAGQPELAEKLASPEAAQLSQRICILTTLQPFSLEDTGKYIEHRLRVAGYQGPPLFSAEAVADIWKRSRGIPREINKVCFNSLLLARATKKNRVESSILREVTSDLDLDRVQPRQQREVTSDLDLDRVQPRQQREVSSDLDLDRVQSRQQREVSSDLDLDRVQSRQPLRLNAMLRSQAVRDKQAGNELVEDMAARIDRLCGDSAPSPIDAEDTTGTDASDDAASSVSESDSGTGVAAAISACYSLGANPDFSEDDAASDDTGLSGNTSQSAELSHALDAHAVEISAPDAFSLSDAPEENVTEENLESSDDEIDGNEELDLHAGTGVDSPEQGGVSGESTFEEQQDFDLNDEEETTDEAIALLESQDWKEVPWTKPWIEHQWRRHYATVCLAVSALALLLALLWVPHPPPTSPATDAEPNRTVSENSSVEPAATTSFPPADYHPKARVWVDVRTDYYYCPGSPMYGTTAGGKFVTQLTARSKNFKPANQQFCQ
jgi:type II secretory pathway predicted ATPase ExeA